MLDLTVGETLYYINKYTFDLEKATVCKVEDEFFSVTFYMGYKELKLYRTRLDNKCLNTRLFKTKREAWDAWDAAHSKQSKKPDDPLAPCSCDDCMLRRSGECTEIRNRICRFFKPVSKPSDEEISWPRHYRTRECDTLISTPPTPHVYWWEIPPSIRREWEDD